ncbi:MAG: hypothetical protein ACQERU_01660 [Bacteroidota bacterium]
MQMVYRIIGVLLINILTCQVVFAQFYSTGQDPASIKWKQINTDNFQVIFPPEYEMYAQQTANILAYSYDKVGKSLKHQPKKISVIIHSQSIRSNGYVAWAPKRIELYPAPPQDMYPESWLQQLCIHELRHVVQIDKLNQGITKVLSLIFGQQATGLVAGQLPMWFYEGDAVATETALSNSGRGRLPYFKRGIRTILLSGEKEYSFDKILFGSYKDYVPNHYEYGYQFNAYVRSKYGVETWSNVVDYVAKNSYTFLPTNFAFNRGLKKNTGLSHKDLFIETFRFLDSTWTSENIEYNYTQPNFLNAKEKDYDNYINPQYISNEDIIALKKGYAHIPQFVLVHKNSEQVLWEPGSLISDDFSVAKKFIVWAEYRPDARWHNKEYTSIKLFNTETKKERIVVDKVRYFSPDIAADANKIAVVEVNQQNKCFLNIISTFNGAIIHQVSPRDGNFIQRPKWSDDERYIYVIEIKGSKKQVSRYDLLNKEWETVFDLANVDIQRIYPSKDHVFFHSTFNGIDNLYAYHFSNQQFYQLTSSKFGISGFDLSPNSTKMAANEYTSHGFRLSEIPLERALWYKIDTASYKKDKMATMLSSQEQNKVNISQIPQSEFQVRPYRRLANLFYFHSWVPFYVDYDEMDYQNIYTDFSEIYNNVHPGVMFISQNKLSTAETILSYSYKNNNHFVATSFVYKGWYPVIKLTADYGDKQQYFAASDVEWIPQLNYDNRTLKIETYIPFNFSRGKYNAGFYPGVSFEYSNRFYYHYLDDYYQKGLEFMNLDAYFYYYTRMAHRDIQPKSGVILNFNLYNAPFDEDFFGYISNIESRIYLPGFFKNHGFKFDVGYQYQSPKLYLYSSLFKFPRGMEKARTEKFTKLYADYVFPITYPDWSLGPVIYLKRIKADLFYDLGINQYNYYVENTNSIVTQKEYLQSFGMEVTFDYHFLRTMFPLNSGIRIGYLPNQQNVFYEFLFGIDLYQF